MFVFRRILEHNLISGTLPIYPEELTGPDQTGVGRALGELAGPARTEAAEAMGKIKQLGLDQSLLSGTLPTWLGMLTSLTYLSASSNSLSGTN